MLSGAKLTTGTCLAIVFAMASAVFVINNTLLEGSLTSPEMLSVEVHAPADSLQLYRISNVPPFHYRVLFPGIVKGTVAMFGTPDADTFFTVYRFWSWFFFTSSALIFFFLMRTLGFNEGVGLGGAAVFLLLPPMLFAYTLPVHTREDTLAYCLLFLGLISIVKEKPLWIFIISVIGVFCRETLLILPLIYFFFSKSSITVRFMILALSVSTFIAWRFFQWEKYDTWEGVYWNIDNPAQVIAFLFLTFNVLWYPVVLSIFSQQRMRANATAAQDFFVRSTPVAIAVVIATTFMGGIFNEIRLLYLAAPWVIITAARFWVVFGSDILRTLKTRGFAITTVVVLVLCGFVAFYVLSNMSMLPVRGRHPVPYELWVIAGTVYTGLTLLFTPAVIRVAMGIFTRQ